MSRRALVGVVAVVALLTLAAMVGFVRDFSGDFHWHVVLGNQTLDEHAIVKYDAFSHTFKGQPVLVTSWLGDVLLAGAFDIGGYATCYTLRALCLVAAFGLLCREMIARGLHPATAAAILATFLAQVMFQLYLRPELFALLSFAVLVHALGCHERTGQRRWLGVALAAILFWANTHGSVSLGLLAVGIYAATRGATAWLRGDRDVRHLLWWAALPVAAFIVACINPAGLGVVLSFTVVTPAWAARWWEWQPLASGGLDRTWVVAAIVVLATTVMAGRRTSWWLVSLVVILAILGWQHRRIARYALYAAGPLLATNLSAIRAHLERAAAWKRWRRVAAGVTSIAALGAGLGLFAWRGLASEIGLGVDRGAYPIDACAWARTQNPDGNLFNNYDLGSFLMYCLGPEHPVFIDGRASLVYSETFFLRYMAAGEQPGALDELARTHDIAWSFVTYDALAARMSSEPDHWRLVYFDDQALIYVRLASGKNRALAAAGFRYLDPARVTALATLDGDALGDADRELAIQRARVPDARRTLLAEAAVAVARRDDAAFAAAVGKLPPAGASLAYLAGVHASNHGDHRTAAGYFAAIRVYGGNPVFSLVHEARELGLGGERDAALERLEQARSLGAPDAVLEDVRRVVKTHADVSPR
jgi:hypothetical protein